MARLMLLLSPVRRRQRMVGVITTREVLRNLRLITHEFGFRCAVRCCWACCFGRKTTFLEIVFY